MDEITQGIQPDSNEDELSKREAQLLAFEKSLKEAEEAFKAEKEAKEAELKAREEELLKKTAESFIETGSGKETQKKTKEGEFATLLAQKERWREKCFEKDEEIKRLIQERDTAIKELEALRLSQEKKEETGKNSSSFNESWAKKIEFYTAHPELGRDEADAIIAMSIGKGIDFEDGLKSDLGRIIIQGIRDKKAKEKATPPPDSSSVSFQGKDFSEMSEEEQRAHFGEIQAEALRSAKQNLNKFI